MHPTPSQLQAAEEVLCTCSVDGKGRFADEDDCDPHHDTCFLRNDIFRENKIAVAVASLLADREAKARQEGAEKVVEAVEQEYRRYNPKNSPSSFVDAARQALKDF